jgi:dipeptidyl aminopeptidase/acylaminoacyl peptidase
MTRRTLNYGCWPSPVTAEMVAGKSLRFGTLQASGGAVYWSESRPEEDGRGVLMRADSGGEVEELLPAPWSARSKVNEYGGGEFLVDDVRVFFVEADTQDIYELGAQLQPRRLTDEKKTRFADMDLDAARNRVVAVCERREGRGEPQNVLATADVRDGGPWRIAVLAEGRDFYASPRVSPDGSTLAWLAWDLPHMPWERAALYVAPFNSDGSLGEARQIAGGDEGAVFQPAWRGDGSHCFVCDESGWGRLHIWDGSASRAITPDGLELMRPQWAFRTQSWTLLDGQRAACAFIENGETWLGVVDLESGHVARMECGLRSIDALAPLGDRVALIGASDTAPPAVVAVGFDGETSSLRSAGETGLSPEDISIGTMLAFEGESSPLHALWYPPANAGYEGAEEELPPAIILVHGGPTGMADRGLKLRTQFWTSRGFAVCDLDYSGSAGYGRAYRQMLDGQWGVRDVEDVASLARHLSKAGLADPKRLLISGSSAGGYTVLMALAVLDMFAAGACTYGVGDLAQLQAITHKFEAGYLYGLTGTDEKTCGPVFAERSPLTHADSIDCPVVFFQGLDDAVVPPAQSRAMFENLRGRGVPVAYMEFEGEGHGFRRAETISAVLENEYAFYARVLGLKVGQRLSDIDIANWPR